ncbi:hypothetical protein P378_05070 [Desulforamulus profundi]|uniref:Uncharacterized protein n=1 Tax=Desulforamulus profundi TaxID=1383067 RepID=A0A2C6MI99_9FIRM|nr:hypothetical protein P378_05070 [Desulforamulus profundi]
MEFLEDSLLAIALTGRICLCRMVFCTKEKQNKGITRCYKG